MAHNEHNIRLNDYEIANLHVALLLLRFLGADTGDWLGQILHKLPPVTQVPNKSLDEQEQLHQNGWIKANDLRKHIMEYEILLVKIERWLADPNILTVHEVQEIENKIKELLDGAP